MHRPIEIGVIDERHSLDPRTLGRGNTPDGGGSIETFEPRDPGTAKRAVSIVQQDRPS
jgi:hypothetical protein